MKKLTLLLLALIIFGIADSIYLVSVELNAAPLVCSGSGAMDCAKVLSPTDSYSSVFGVPLAYYALAWFIVSALVFASRKPKLELWYFTGLAGAIYSITAMPIIRTICIYRSVLDATPTAIAAAAFLMI